MKKTDLINKTIHGYRVQSFVAEGGMAWVFKAVHKEMNQTVALKMIRPEVRDDAKALERFEYTAKLQAKIKHPNIVFVYDFFKEEFSGATRHFLIEEFVDGSSLDNLIRKKNISAEKALQICREVLIGLEAAHKQGVVHRDIKPDNVMIDRTGTAKVTDFGIAKEWRTDSHLTRTRTAIGSPQYMSPEQITSPRNLDHRTDIYSTGIMLYQLVCGRLPFERKGGTEYQIMMAHVNEPPPTFERWSLDVSPDLETAIFKALAKKRADRFSSAFDFANALKNINLSLGMADYLRIGRSHFQDRRFHEASSFFSRVLKLKPNHTESTQALRQIELCKGFIGNVNKAIKMLETSNFSEFHDTYEMLSRQYRKNQNLEAVLSEYQTELDRQRTSKIHALIHEASNAQNSNIAKQHYADCLKLDPENQAARRAFAGNIKKNKKQAPKRSKNSQQTAGLLKLLLLGIGFIIFIIIGLVIYFVIAQSPTPEPTTYLTPGQTDNQSDLPSPQSATPDKSDSLVNPDPNITDPTSNPPPMNKPEPEQGTLVFNKTTDIRINGDNVYGTRVEHPPDEHKIECFERDILFLTNDVINFKTISLNHPLRMVKVKFSSSCASDTKIEISDYNIISVDGKGDAAKTSSAISAVGFSLQSKTLKAMKTSQIGIYLQMNARLPSGSSYLGSLTITAENGKIFEPDFKFTIE